MVSAVGYRSTEPTPRLHRGLPSPALTLVLSLDEPIVTGHTPAQASGPDADRHLTVIGGLHTHPAYIAQPDAQMGVHLALWPLAARALLGMPAGEVRQLSADGTEVLGPELARVRERMCEADRWSRRFALLADFLRHRYREAERQPEPRPEVVEAWRWLALHRGTGSIEGLARHVMLSRRQLTDLFRAETGVTPKTASRLMRFEQARQRIAQTLVHDEDLDLAAVAHASGYYDHSHLVRDFQQYTGVSPTGWLAEERRNIQAGTRRHGEDLNA